MLAIQARFSRKLPPKPKKVRGKEGKAAAAQHWPIQRVRSGLRLTAKRPTQAQRPAPRSRTGCGRRAWPGCSCSTRVNADLGRGPKSRLPEDEAGLAATLPKIWRRIGARRSRACGARSGYDRKRALPSRAERRQAWAEINGTNRSWFGMIANRVTGLALSLKAAAPLRPAPGGH
jgi:hypothetical protein